MTTQQKLDLLQLSILGGGGLLQGLQQRRNAQIAQEQNLYERRSAARAAQLAAASQGLGRQATAAETFLAGSPLGAEQALAQRNAKAYNLIGGLANMPSPAGYGGVFNPFVGLDRTSWGQGATAAAIAERRKALAAVNPQFQFGDMSLYGLGDTTAASQGVSDYAAFAAKQQADAQKKIDDLLAQEVQDAQQSGQSAQKKGSKAATVAKIIGSVAPLAIGAIPGSSRVPFLSGAPAGTSYLNNLRSSLSSPQTWMNVAAPWTGAAAPAVYALSNMTRPTTPATPGINRETFAPQPYFSRVDERAHWMAVLSDPTSSQADRITATQRLAALQPTTATTQTPSGLSSPRPWSNSLF